MKFIFLDRDGVINRFPGYGKYVTSWKGFRFLPGAKKALALFKSNGYKVFIVSNQAGVGKGIFSRKALNHITSNMLKSLKKAKGDITQVYYCTHRKEERCACRKPKAGMLKKAAKKYKFKLRDSIFIGDTIRDVLTAKAAGCRSVLVLSGYEKKANWKDWEAKPHFVFKNLLQAAKSIARR